MTTTPTAPPDRPATERRPLPADGTTAGTSAPATGRGPATQNGGERRRLRYVLAGAVLVGAFGFLIVKGLGSALDFYLPANQAVAQRAELAGRTFNLEGLVRPGSIRATPHGVDFVLTAGRTAVAVANTGSPPQLFQADIPVIAVGHFAGASFVSDQILVKHTATYIAAHPNRVTAPNGTKR
ncbi:MAG TPA: cytochrome c maturation protein CcmE [Acidimicrobiales bacterium]|nr:cytochrome c maturation protein CcmE [Acidimicrobiales bacterium]